MRSRTPYSFLVIAAFTTLAITPAWSVPQIKVTEAKELEITAADGTNAKLPTGTIGRQINADKQFFKVSYGKDLRGRTNIIIYPDPEKPQALELKVLDQDVKMTSDAVLTIISEDSSSTTQFQSGMVGTVTVGAEQLTSGASAKLSPAGLATVAANTPVFAPEPPAPAKKSDSAAPAADEDAESPAKSGATAGEVATYQGPKVRAIEGDVMIAPPGQDVLEMLKTAANVPRLNANDRIPTGSTIQTGPQGKAIISPFPGCIIAVQPNSKLTLSDVQYINTDYGKDVVMTPAAMPNGAGMEYIRTKHNYQRKAHLNLIEGGVLSTIKGIKPETLDYQVKTPLAVAAARGTIFGVFGDPSKTLAIVAEGVVEVKTPDGTFSISIKGGNKILITKDGGAPMEFVASSDELAAFQALQDSFRNFINEVDILATGDLIGTAMADDKLQDAIEDFRTQFQPRLNDFYMTPIKSPGT